MNTGYKDPGGVNNPEGKPSGPEDKDWTCPYCGGEYVSAGTHLTKSDCP